MTEQTEVNSWIAQREHFFNQRLAEHSESLNDFVQEKDRLSLYRKGRLYGFEVINGQKVFTGRFLCGLASISLKLALSETFEDLQTEFLLLFFKSNSSHIILSVKNNSETWLIDPTIGQIQSRLNSIEFFDSNRIDDHYPLKDFLEIPNYSSYSEYKQISKSVYSCQLATNSLSHWQNKSYTKYDFDMVLASELIAY